MDGWLQRARKAAERASDAAWGAAERVAAAAAKAGAQATESGSAAFGGGSGGGGGGSVVGHEVVSLDTGTFSVGKEIGGGAYATVFEGRRIGELTCRGGDGGGGGVVGGSFGSGDGSFASFDTYRVALKRVVLLDESSSSMAKDEIRVLRSLPAHPSLLPLLASGLSNARVGSGPVRPVAWLAFPLASGGCLVDAFHTTRSGGVPTSPAEVDASTRLGPVLAAAVGRDLADALAAMHARDLVHADVKPHNVLLLDKDAAKRARRRGRSGNAAGSVGGVAANADGGFGGAGGDGNGATDPPLRVALADFGSARRAGARVSSRSEALALAEVAERCSSAPYRAPELWEPPVPSVTSTASDVFALGATLYWLAVGESPFERAAGVGGSLSLAIMGGRYDWPQGPEWDARFRTDRDWGALRALRAVVADCLDTRPERRPSAAQVADSLARIAGDAGRANARHTGEGRGGARPGGGGIGGGSRKLDDDADGPQATASLGGAEATTRAQAQAHSNSHAHEHSHAHSHARASRRVPKGDASTASLEAAWRSEGRAAADSGWGVPRSSAATGTSDLRASTARGRSPPLASVGAAAASSDPGALLARAVDPGAIRTRPAAPRAGCNGALGDPGALVARAPPDPGSLGVAPAPGGTPRKGGARAALASPRSTARTPATAAGAAGASASAADAFDLLALGDDDAGRRKSTAPSRLSPAPVEAPDLLSFDAPSVPAVSASAAIEDAPTISAPAATVSDDFDDFGDFAAAPVAVPAPPTKPRDPFADLLS